MEVKQISSLLNVTITESLGETTLVTEDLSNIVSVGEAVLNSNAVENFTKKLVDHIGKMVFVSRAYGGNAPSVLMDSWEFGSVLEKVHCKLPDDSDNPTWELQKGVSIDQNIFTPPEVDVKFYNDATTFEIPISITDKQLKSAFSNATQMNSFLSMIFQMVENRLTVDTDNLILRTIDNMIGETLATDEITSDTTAAAKTTARCVNLLKLYNDENGTTLTKAVALRTPDFLRYAVNILLDYKGFLRSYSTLFNIGGQERFTPETANHTILLNQFVNKVKTQLYSVTYNKEDATLPAHETITYWQGSGTSYAFDDVSKINIKTSEGNSVELSGIIGVMFDREALGVNNFEREIPSHRIERAHFTNYWYQQKARYFNDFNENMVVFYLA